MNINGPNTSLLHSQKSISIAFCSETMPLHWNSFCCHSSVCFPVLLYAKSTFDSDITLLSKNCQSKSNADFFVIVGNSHWIQVMIKIKEKPVAFKARALILLLLSLLLLLQSMLDIAFSDYCECEYCWESVYLPTIRTHLGYVVKEERIKKA